MHVTLLTIGSRGDIEPYLALGSGLREVGHTVRVATHERYRPEIEQAGLEFSPLPGDPRQLVETEEGRRWLESGRNPVKMMGRLLDLVGPHFDQYLRDAETAVSGTQMVLFSVLGFPAYHLAEAAGIPAMGAWLQPMSRTQSLPSAFLPAWMGRLPFANLWSHVLTEQVSWLPLRKRVNRWRAGLGLDPLPMSGLYRPIYRTMPVLYGFSPSVVPPPSDWPAQIRVTGYWFREGRSDWRPPTRLTDFLSSGPQPAYIGFGSRPERRPQDLAELALTALRRAGLRGVLLTGWGGLSSNDSSDDILVVDEVPHGWLFPRMAAIVHHGGAGTTGTTLESGTPSIVVPSFADQFYWAERTAGLGVGVNLPRRRLTVGTLAAALLTATTDQTMRARAGELGEVLRGEDGVGCAVEELARLLDG